MTSVAPYLIGVLLTRGDEHATHGIHPAQSKGPRGVDDSPPRRYMSCPLAGRLCDSPDEGTRYFTPTAVIRERRNPRDPARPHRPLASANCPAGERRFCTRSLAKLDSFTATFGLEGP